MKTNNIPNSPRYIFARKVAINALISCKALRIPISPYGVIQQLLGKNNCRFKKYSVLAKEINKPIEYVSNRFQSKDAIGNIDEKNRLCIAYNDTIFPASRITYSIAHELGHYLLGHYEFNKNLSLLNLNEQAILETEADIFARELLVPQPVINEFSKHFLMSPQTVSDIFEVSLQAATHISNTYYYKGSTSLNEYKKIELFRILNVIIKNDTTQKNHSTPIE